MKNQARHKPPKTRAAICLVYDCLYPHTVGGAERWYRNLALRLAEGGHDVTYLTMRQWDEADPPQLPGVRVVAVSPRMHLYAKGKRRVAPPLVFGLGVFRHLALNGSRYDVVHTASFPYFSLLAAGVLRRAKRYRLVVDWHEVWTPEYWREYLGSLGSFGFRIQRRCVRLQQEAFCFSRLHAERLKGEGVGGGVTVLRGQYEGPVGPPGETALGAPVVVFAGRHIPEKQVPSLVPAVAFARKAIPDLRCEIYGDGPDRDDVLRLVAANELEEAIDVPGFVAQARIDAALAGASCLVLPSRREGYGLVVVEALARGTPVVVVAGPDNAAVELVEEGVNGTVATSASPRDLGEAIVRVLQAEPLLRRSTAEWFAQHRKELSLETSVATVVAAYDPLTILV
jgi:glycosyltransferase involved in cell wall biosynthesis